MPEAVPFEEWFVELCASHGLVEGSHQGSVDYRAGGKIVVNLEAGGAVTIKLPVDEQQALLQAHPEIVSLPGGWAKHGWTTIVLEALDRDQVRELLAIAIDTVTRPVAKSRKPRRTNADPPRC